MILISGLVNVKTFRNDNEPWSWTENIWTSVSNIVAIVLLSLAFILPVFIACYIWPRYYKLQEPSIANVLSPLYGMVDTGEGIKIAQDD